MASACVNIGVTHHDNFHNNHLSWSILPDLQCPVNNDLNSDFEFRLQNNSTPVTMLPADELFLDGKLVPLHFPRVSTHKSVVVTEPKSPEKDHVLLSPKAPKCSSRWRDFLGFKNKQEIPSTTTKSIKTFLRKKTNTSLTTLLLESSISSSSRHSVSSSSCSSHEHDDLPRFSLDDKPKRVRLVRQTPQDPKPLIDHRTRRVLDPSCSIDSPRMNPAGKIVFQSLGRSSSSPSSLNGGPRYKYRGMERSYSANVRVTPVLNVPVCSLRGSSKSGSFGFRQLFLSPSSSSTQKKDREGSSRTCVHRKKESTSS